MCRLIAGFIVAVLLTSVTGQSMAKDVCVKDNGNDIYLFKNVKPLKKKGQFSPIEGVIIFGSQVIPISGSAFVRADSSVVVGLIAHNDLNSGSFIVNASGPSLDTATNVVGRVLSSGAITGLATWDKFNCKSVVIP